MLGCAVCLREEAKSPVVTRCGHVFCWPCLFRWAWAPRGRYPNFERNSTCPLCKSPLPDPDSHVTPIFATSSSSSSHNHDDDDEDEEEEEENNNNNNKFPVEMPDSSITFFSIPPRPQPRPLNQLQQPPSLTSSPSTRADPTIPPDFTTTQHLLVPAHNVNDIIPQNSSEQPPFFSVLCWFRLRRHRLLQRDLLGPNNNNNNINIIPPHHPIDDNYPPVFSTQSSSSSTSATTSTTSGSSLHALNYPQIPPSSYVEQHNSPYGGWMIPQFQDLSPNRIADPSQLINHPPIIHVPFPPIQQRYAGHPPYPLDYDCLIHHPIQQQPQDTASYGPLTQHLQSLEEQALAAAGPAPAGGYNGWEIPEALFLHPTRYRPHL